MAETSLQTNFVDPPATLVGNQHQQHQQQPRAFRSSAYGYRARQPQNQPQNQSQNQPQNQSQNQPQQQQRQRRNQQRESRQNRASSSTPNNEVVDSKTSVDTQIEPPKNDSVEILNEQNFEQHQQQQRGSRRGEPRSRGVEQSSRGGRFRRERGNAPKQQDQNQNQNQNNENQISTFNDETNFENLNQDQLPKETSTQLNETNQSGEKRQPSRRTRNFDRKQNKPENHDQNKPARQRHKQTDNEGQSQIQNQDVQTIQSSDAQAISSSPEAPHHKRERNKPRQQNKKDEVSDLVRTLSTRLSRGSYECMVCYDKVGKNASVWSCNSCYAVFHLSCIQQWSQKSGKEAGWRCPGCQNMQTIIPSEYRCFCGKLTNPKWDPYFTPHSCGDICSKKKPGTCPHPCTLPCHPGPCPPCGLFAPLSYCFCGKTGYRLKCGETDNGKSCDNACGKTLNCKKHSCLKTCHQGDCGDCTHTYERVCYCGKTNKNIFCGKEDHSENGYFSCEEICGRELACGNHKCQRKCHKGKCGDCPLLPTLITSCPCGATLLSELNLKRTSCTEPIPTCTRKCNKPLACISNLHHLDHDKTHFCQEQCHLGECPPCKESIKIGCSCGNASKTVICGTQDEKTIKEFRCTKVCKVQRHCGRHQCGAICCPSKGSAYFELHECPNVCQKKLRCGKHFCQLPCHRGPCPSCLQASFDELACPCGNTKIFPPVPCGAVLPPCRHPCSRHHPCGHPPNHNCHPDDSPCPPCTILAPKKCGCSRKLVVMTPCYRKEGNCGRICGNKLKCGHPCARVCHTGECEDPNSPCKSQCGKKKKCGHPCRSNCHYEHPCPNNPCQDLVAISCKCGRRVDRIVCGEGDQKLVGAKLPQPRKTLDCDEECMREERNRRLAEALDIQPETHQRKEAEYPKTLFEFCNRNTEFVKRVESSMKDFLNGDKKVYNFLPMKGDQRAFIHELCPFYDFKSESVDLEPRRSVIIRKTLNSREPINLLSETFKRGDWINLELPNPNILVKTKKTVRRFPTAVNAIVMYGVDPLVQVEEMREVVKQFITIGFDIAKIAATTIVILPDNPWKDDMDKFESFLEQSLNTLKRELSSVFTSISCCWVNQDHEVTAENIIDFKKKTETSSSKGESYTQQQQESKIPISVIKNPFDLLEETDIIEESKKSADPWEEPGKYEGSTQQQQQQQQHHHHELSSPDQEKSLTDSWEHVEVQPETTPVAPSIPPIQYIVDEIEVPSDWTSLLPEDD